MKLSSQTLDYVAETTPTFDPTYFHLQELISEAAAPHREPDAKGLTITVNNLVDFSIDLEADRAQLFRAFTNLIGNARNAGAETVEIAAFQKNGTLTIDVDDDGHGFADNARAKIFQPFVGSVREGGTGLGLVIVRDVLKAHGGDIELLDSESKGAIFRITLPMRVEQLSRV